MIEGIVLSGFRAFGERVEARFAPITLVYGPNSAGKSSLVKSLQFLRQSALDPYEPFFRFGGPYVDLGGARMVAHRHRATERICVEVELGGGHFAGPLIDAVSVGFEITPEGEAHDRFNLLFSGQGADTKVSFARLPGEPQLVRLADGPSRKAFSAMTRQFAARGESLFDEEDSLTPVFDLNRLVPCTIVGHLGQGRSSRLQRIAPENLSHEHQRWNALARRTAGEFGESLDRISYLGPLRRPWRRAEAVRPVMKAAGVGPEGENSLAVLATRPDILSQVNESLLELETGYELVLTKWEGAADPVLHDLAPAQMVPSLRHIGSGVSISPADAGFGLSQLLPIIIEMHHRDRSLICIEQPELHLHPRLQARFGQLLRDAVAGRSRNRFLVETHSEHLLLRIQRLVREEMLDPAEVAVLYVDNQVLDKESGAFHASISSSILELRLDESGALLDPWPGGFFSERWDEWQ